PNTVKEETRSTIPTVKNEDRTTKGRKQNTTKGKNENKDERTENAVVRSGDLIAPPFSVVTL
ncbi:hypothetical protein A2U01_0087293, partial [Trifolium medium]|nr:hypothetical protein [Trifolium medium]